MYTLLNTFRDLQMLQHIQLITGTEVLNGRSAPERALIDFYRAFNHRDLAHMAQNWSHAKHVVLCNPLGGVKRGWAEIEAVYQRIFTGAATVYVEYYDITLNRVGDLFYATGRERGTFKTAQVELPLAIRTTRIYQDINGTWKQIHHHGSIDDAALLASYQQAVM